MISREFFDGASHLVVNHVYGSENKPPITYTSILGIVDNSISEETGCFSFVLDRISLFMIRDCILTLIKKWNDKDVNFYGHSEVPNKCFKMSCSTNNRRIIFSNVEATSALLIGTYKEFDGERINTVCNVQLLIDGKIYANLTDWLDITLPNWAHIFWGSMLFYAEKLVNEQMLQYPVNNLDKLKVAQIDVNQVSI